MATNSITDKVYIGMTSKTLEKRKKEHYITARNPKFQFHRAIKKYSEECFTWEVIDTADNIEDLKEKEVAWIYYYDSYRNGYNMTIGGEGTFGIKRSEKTRKKMSIVRKGRFIGKDSPSYGLKRSKETRKKISEGRRGECGSNAKLTSDKVLEIRELYESKTYNHSELGKLFEVNRRTINDIINFKTWKNI